MDVHGREKYYMTPAITRNQDDSVLAIKTASVNVCNPAVTKSLSWA